MASAMVLLPVAYLGLTAAVAWGLWTYGRFATGTLLPEHNSTIGILLVLLPLFVGATILLCLVKPLFARFAPPSRPVRLKAGEEPLLFAFVARLCEALHAPVPREIHVDCEVNASASFRRGWLSLFQHDLVLTIGLPLIAGLPLQQLAGVMAHELGHFSQTAGLRVSLVIRTINFWLTRLVYQRDRIDVALERAAKQLRSVQLRMAVRIALLSVAFTRKVLWALMMLGHTLCAYLLRQMEFEADRYEVRLAGFSSFDLCMRELFALNIAHSMALESLQEQWKERRLVDNLPRMIVANRRQAGRSIGLEVERRIAQQVEGRFSTHPTSRQRIARALREKGVGVFASDLPAAVLFADVEALERRVSLALYQQQLGNQIKSQYLVPHEEIRERQERTEAEGASLDRYFQCPSPLKGLPLPSCLPPSADPAVAARQLAAARRGHSRSDDDHARAATRYGEAVEARFVALQAQALLEAGFLLRPGQFGLVDGTLQEALDATEETARRMSAAAGELAGFEAKETGRLLLALSLLETPAEAERLLACAALLGERFTALFNLRETGSILDILGLQAKPDRANPRLGAAIQEHFGLLLEQLKELHRGLRAAEYPFDHAEPGITLARFVIPAMPPANDYGGLIGATEQAVQRMNEVYQRLLGRLVRLAEEVEAALAAPPPDALPVPEPARSPALPAVARPSQEIVESKAEAVASRDRFAIYFKDVPELRILDLPALPAAERSALEEARAAAAHGMSAYAQRSRQYQAAERKYLQALRAEQILSAGLPLRPADFSPLPTTFPAIVQAGDQALAEMNALEPGLQAFETILAQRLVASLALLRSDDRLAARMTDAERRRGEIPVLLAGAQALQRTFPALRELRQRYTILRGLAEQVAVAGQDPRFRACVGAQVVEVHKHLQELQRGLQGAFSPFADDPDRAGRRDLAQRILPNLPRQDDVNGNFQMAGSALRELPDLHRRILGRLAETADEVERSLGGA